MKKMPRKIRVGAYEWDVRVDKTTCYAAGVNGVCMEDDHVILMADNLVPSAERETLFHETMHALWGQTGLEKHFTDAQEEEVIWTLSPLLFSMLRDNPKLVEYLLEK